MAERLIRTLQEQCTCRPLLKSLHVTEDWMFLLKRPWPHQARAMHTPAEAFKLAT